MMGLSTTGVCKLNYVERERRIQTPTKTLDVNSALCKCNSIWPATFELVCILGGFCFH